MILSHTIRQYGNRFANLHRICFYFWVFYYYVNLAKIYQIPPENSKLYFN